MSIRRGPAMAASKSRGLVVSGLFRTMSRKVVGRERVKFLHDTRHAPAQTASTLCSRKPETGLHEDVWKTHLRWGCWILILQCFGSLLQCGSDWCFAAELEKDTSEAVLKPQREPLDHRSLRRIFGPSS
eukprot:scaffold1019_cov255-Pinguiococcus_pyrenoidosus.AAC.4